MGSLRKFTIRFSYVLNITAGLLFLLACCNAFLHPEKWWFIAMLAFFFPLFLVIVIGFFVLLAIAHPRYAWISVICLIVGWQNIHAFFGFSLATHDFPAKRFRQHQAS